MLTNFPAEGTGPFDNWGDHFENGCLNCPKENTSASHWDKNIYFRPGKFAFRPKTSQDGQWFCLLGCCQIKQLLTRTKITPKAMWWRKHEECRRKSILNLKSFILQLARSLLTKGDFASQGVFGDVWRHFWLSRWGEREELLLVSGRQRADPAKPSTRCLGQISATRHCRAPNINSVKVEKPWTRYRCDASLPVGSGWPGHTLMLEM